MKILRGLLLFFLLPFLLIIYYWYFVELVIHFIGHRNVRLGAYWKIRWVERYRRRLPYEMHQATMALLRFDATGQKFDQILQRCGEEYKIESLEDAFRYFVAQEDYPKALEYTEQWSALTATGAAKKPEPMRAFFAEHGTDLSYDDLVRLYLDEKKEFDRLSKDNHDPQSNHPNSQEINRRRFYTVYYRSQLAVGIMRWIAAQDAAQLEHIKVVFKEVCQLQYNWRIKFAIDKALAVRLGMSEAAVEALHDSIVGAVNSEATRVQEPEA